MTAASIPLLRRIGPARRVKRAAVFLAVLVLVMAATVAYSHEVGTTWTATAYMEVNSGAGRSGPGDASGAQQLATSYAFVIPDDQAVVAAIAAATGRPEAEVKPEIEVYAANNSAELVLSYAGPSSSAALTGMRALVQTVARGGGALVPGTVSVVSLPTEAVPSSHHRLLAYGGMIALVVAISVVLLLERIDPRVRDAAELEEVLGVPVVVLADLGGESGWTLLCRWHGGVDGGQAIQLVPAEGCDEDKVEQLADRLRQWGTVGPIQALPAPETGALPSARGTTVLLVAAGARARSLVAAVSRLAMFGSAPDWAVIFDRGPEMRIKGPSSTRGSSADLSRPVTRRSAIAHRFPDARPLSSEDLASLFSGDESGGSTGDPRHDELPAGGSPT